MKPNYTDIINQSKKYDLYAKKHTREKPEITTYHEGNYDHLDWLYVKEAKDSLVFNPEGMKVRQKIIERLKK